MFKGFLWSLFFAFLVGCTAGPDIQKYSQVHIERSYTLPSGVAQWETKIPYWFERNDVDRNSLPPAVPLPIFWSTSLSDRLTLHWRPIPAALSWRILEEDRQMLGITGGLSGLGYASGSGFMFGPQLSVDYWYRLSERVSIRPKVYGAFLHYTESKATLWTAGFLVSSFFQVRDWLALAPGVGIELRDGIRGVSSLYFSRVHSGQAVLYPVRLAAQFNLGQQWDAGVTYRFLSFPAAESYQLHEGEISLTHSW